MSAPFAVPFSSLGKTDDQGDEIPFEETYANTELQVEAQPPNLAPTFEDKVWDNILPGLERACIILRGQDYQHKEIAFILGLKTEEVGRTLYRIRNRLFALGYRQFKNLI